MILLVAAWVFPGTLFAQQQQSALTPSERAALAPTETDIYCAGFFTHRSIEQGLFVLGGEEGGFKNEYSDRDILFLSQGRGWINAPGGQYMLIRPVRDIDPKEFFPGQQELMVRLGTLYAEVARIEVRIVHESSATAEVLASCEPVLAGDIAIPLQTRPAPPYRSEQRVDRFAPPSGKATGVIVLGQDFRQTLGPRHVVYLDVGSSQGAQVGGYLRIFQTPINQDSDLFQQAARNYPTEAMGMRMGRKLTPADLASLPRTVLG
ncbi:MAG: hypothetical protein Q8P12_01665, partial [bacterium]|nr:hypothetical protein [bacterium]